MPTPIASTKVTTTSTTRSPASTSVIAGARLVAHHTQIGIGTVRRTAVVSGATRDARTHAAIPTATRYRNPGTQTCAALSTNWRVAGFARSANPGPSTKQIAAAVASRVRKPQPTLAPSNSPPAVKCDVGGCTTPRTT